MIRGTRILGTGAVAVLLLSAAPGRAALRIRLIPNSYAKGGGVMLKLPTMTYRGVRYILSGGGGSPLWPVPWVQRVHHYLTVRVGPEGVQDTIHRLDGTQSQLPH